MKTKQAINRLLANLGLRLCSLEYYTDVHSLIDARTNLCASLFAAIDPRLAQNDKQTEDFITFIRKNWRESNSQFLQDLFVLWCFAKKQSGTYLEIGGADGITHSNTLYLRRSFGWTGILVEPDDTQFWQCKHHRPKPDQVMNCAIATREGQQELNMVLAGQLSSVIGYHSRDQHSEARENMIAQQETKKVPAVNINSILAKFSHLDYLSLDVEGAEEEILRTIDWQHSPNPQVCTIEVNENPRARAIIQDLMMSNGYILMMADGAWLTACDLWFAKKELAADIKQRVEKG